ncbi:MAG: hypothetical protein HYX54_10120 [Chloroflexi bacterium]|nr:hypothetical protein [Chloroflexota bacterium]
MGVGDTQAAFRLAAAGDGIALSAVAIEGLTDAGHIGLPDQFEPVAGLLRRIFRALDGDEADLSAGTHRLLKPDWFHDPTGTVVEVDEFQHFTTDRLRTLLAYPDDVALGFDRQQYIDLCRRWRGKADRYRAFKEARGFRRSGGRRAQRAYFDTVRDLVVPALGFNPVIRAAAYDDDGAATYTRMREMMIALLRGASN